MKENFPADNSIALCDASSDCAHDVKTGSIVSSASTTKLKPCPFCGSTETMDMQYDGDFWVQCAGCNCSTQVFDSEAESHKAWDTRAQPSDGALTNEGAEPVAWQIRAICSDGTRMGWRDVSKARFQEATSSAILSASAGGHVDWECRQLYSNPPAPTSAPPPKVCTCPSGDGSLRWPCPVHPPEVKALVLPERMPVPDADCPERTNAQGWNACLDRVKELNS